VGGNYVKIRRGGSFDSASKNIRSLKREAGNPGYFTNIGFRLARTK